MSITNRFRFHIDPVADISAEPPFLYVEQRGTPAMNKGIHLLAGKNGGVDKVVH
jgi:hypothetical protein